MEDTSGNKDKQICLGLVAHVDSGKTTLAESILYQSGQIRTLGRVDHFWIPTSWKRTAALRFFPNRHRP